MKPLYTPWRMNYIKNISPSNECVFCSALKAADGPENLIVARGSLAFVILNRFPYASGHLMVVPYAHVPSFEALDKETRSEIMELLTRSMQALERIYQPAGYNVGVNIGAVAGAGIAAHLHFHVVPRWFGDSNFMSTVGETRVLPEDLGVTYQRVCEDWEKFPS
jgi:ATP adenylyltransferase